MGLRIGVLHDLPRPDGGEDFARMLQLGFAQMDTEGGGEPLDVVGVVADGAPRAGEDAVRAAMEDLIRSDVVAVVGPAITDSALAVLPLVEQAALPTVNYAGSQRARSSSMFQYQVGSLEEEPYLLAAELERRGLRRIGVVRETSVIGDELFLFLDDACRRHGLDTASVSVVGPDGGGAEPAAAALRDADVEAAIYLGLGMSARALGEAMQGVEIPMLANSALMFGHAMPDWTQLWEGWSYVDVFDDDNRVLAELRRRFPASAGPITLAVPYDLGRLLGAAVRHAATRDRAGVAAALELVKRLPAALGADGTWMGFGRWDHSALKGDYLVLRRWHAGRSVPAE